MSAAGTGEAVLDEEEDDDTALSIMDLYYVIVYKHVCIIAIYLLAISRLLESKGD